MGIIPLSDLATTVKAILRGKPGTTLYSSIFYILLGQAITAILGFLFWVVAARNYTPASIGLASAALSGAGFVTSLAALGLHTGMIRFLPQEKDKGAIINSSFTLVALVSLLGALVFLAGLPWWSPSLLFLWDPLWGALAFVAVSVLGSLMAVQSSVLWSLRRAELSTLQNGLAALSRIPLLFALAPLAALGIVGAWPLAGLMAFLVGNFLLMRLLHDYRPQLFISSRVIHKVFPFSISNHIADTFNLPVSLLPLIVLVLLGAEETAYYRIGYAVASMLFMIPASVNSSLFIEGSNEPQALRRHLVRAIRFSLLVLLVAVAFIYLLGPWMLSFLFGHDYSTRVAPLLLLLSLAALPHAANELYVATSRVQMRTRPILVLYFFTSFITVGVSYVLLPRLGVTGIGVAWILGQVIPATFAIRGIVGYLRP